MGEKETSSQPVPQSQSKKNISCCPPPPCHFYCLFKIKDSAGRQSEELRDHQHQQVSLNCVDSGHRGTGTDQPGGTLLRGGGHCCLHVESLRILLAVETPLREGFDDEEDRRSALALLFRALPSVPFTQTGLARGGLWSACP